MCVQVEIGDDTYLVTGTWSKHIQDIVFVTTCTQQTYVYVYYSTHRCIHHTPFLKIFVGNFC